MPMMPPPPPPDFDDDRSQLHAAPGQPRELAAWVAIFVTVLAGAFGIYGSHVTAMGQVERLEERVSANEQSLEAMQALLSDIKTEIAGLRSDVQGLERITQVQLGEIQRRMERAEQQVQRRRER